MKKAIISLLILITSNSYGVQQSLMSGDIVGNGGDVIHCKKNTILLDFYENRIQLAKRLQGMGHQQMVQTIINKLKRFSPKQAKIYQRRFDQFLTQSDFLENKELKDIKDSKHLFEPAQSDCSLKQIAIRKLNPMPNQKQFLINKKLWSHLDEQNKAGLILHEIIYEHLIKLGATDSIKARYLNAHFFSNNFMKSNKIGYWGLVRKLRVPIYH